MNRGDIYFVDFSTPVGVEMGGARPVIIISSNDDNMVTPTILVAPLTSKLRGNLLPTHVRINAGQGGVEKDSLVLLEQIRAIDKRRLMYKVGSLEVETMAQVFESLKAFIGLKEVNESFSEPARVITALEISNLSHQYNKFYEVLDKHTEKMEEFHKDFVKSGSFKSKFIEWIISGIIGAIISALIF